VRKIVLRLLHKPAFLSPATTKALIQSNQQLMKTGGFQGAKEKGFFGIVNAYQWYMGSWK
jgi:hypothetical protein